MANTAITFDSGRQYGLFASKSLVLANISTTATAVTIIKLPVNSIVVGGYVVVDTATDAGTSMTVKIGDSSSDNRYLAATSSQATGKTSLLTPGYINTGGLDITITPTIVGTAPTVGALRVIVEYIIDGRVNDNQPN